MELKSLKTVNQRPLEVCLNTRFDNTSQYIPEATIEEIRHAVNKAWVLGDNRFKQ